MRLVSHCYKTPCLETDLLKPWTLKVLAAFGPNPNLLETFTECHHPSFQACSVKRHSGAQFLISVAAIACGPIAALSRGPNSTTVTLCFQVKAAAPSVGQRWYRTFASKNWYRLTRHWWNEWLTTYRREGGWAGKGDSGQWQLSAFVTVELRRLLISTGSHHLSGVTNVFIVAGKINLFPSSCFEEQEVGGGTLCA